MGINQLVSKYKYFIPIIGMLLLIYDVYFSWDWSILDKYYGGKLEMILLMYCIIIQIPCYMILTSLLFMNY